MCLVRLGLLMALTSVGVAATPALKLTKTVELPQVKGGFDLMAADAPGHRLFLAAEDNNTVEVIDLQAAKHIQSITGLNEPKWVVYRPEANRLYVSCGGDGSVRILDSTTFQETKRFDFKEKANNLRYDPVTKELFVGVGKGLGAIGIIDIVQDRVSGEIKLASFPKQFELSDNQIFVNVPEANHIAVIDRAKGSVVKTWPVKEAKDNVPMGASPNKDRLFIGCEPGKLVVIDTESGQSLTSIDIDPEPDSVYYESKRKRIYVSCGAGFIDVIAQAPGDHYTISDRIPTAKGAATSLLIPQLDLLCLPVPQRQQTPAELRIYAVNP